MNIIKSMFIFLSCTMVLIGSVLFYGSFINRNIYAEDFIEQVADEINISKPVDTALQELHLPETKRKQMIDVIETKEQELIKSDEFQALLKEYSSSILHDVVQEQSSKTNMNKELQSLFIKYKDDAMLAFQGYLKQEQLETMFDQLITNIDIQPIYDQVVDAAKQHTTPLQQQLISFVLLISSSNTTILGIIFMIAGLIILLCLQRPYRWILSLGISITLSGVCLLIGKLAAELILDSIITINYEALYDFIIIEIQRLQLFGLCYLGIGIIWIIIWFVIQKVMQRKPSYMY